jgi:transposase
MAKTASPGDHPLDTMLAVSDLISHPRYRQIYARVLTLDTPTVEEVADGLDSSTTTVYEDVNHLVENGLLARVTETQPHRYSTREIDLTVRSEERDYDVTPALLVALARSERNETIELYLDRHGRAGLATALDYARKFARGRTTARIVAREEEIPVLEAETILQELRDLLLDVEDDLSRAVEIEELDEAVDS